MTVKIKYLGPREKIDVPPHGEHMAGQTKAYPAAFARELISTSRRQMFEIVEAGPPKAPPAGGKKNKAKAKGESK